MLNKMLANYINKFDLSIIISILIVTLMIIIGGWRLFGQSSTPKTIQQPTPASTTKSTNDNDTPQNTTTTKAIEQTSSDTPTPSSNQNSPTQQQTIAPPLNDTSYDDDDEYEDEYDDD